MESTIELLEESRNNWQDEANHERRQIKSSLFLVVGSAALAGIGIGTILGGEISGGILEVAVGVSFSYLFAKVGLDEVQQYAEMTSLANERQHQIEIISN